MTMVSENSCEDRLRDHPLFNDSEEEASYWKKIAQEYFHKLQDVRDEMEEFQEGSQELEGELEAQLEQYENRVDDLVNTKCKLEEENDALKEKLERLQCTSCEEVTKLQDENAALKGRRDEMTKHIRELEQTNDDLERGKRATVSSLEAFDARLNNAIERNAFLEIELEEKEELIITMQRLKDESRDLKSELAAITSLNESKPQLEEPETNNDCELLDNKSKGSPSRIPQVPSSANGLLATTNLSTVRKKLLQRQSSKNGTVAGSANISALNIVSDLLGKVSALESKLASCRNFVLNYPSSGDEGVPLNGVHSYDAITDTASILNRENSAASSKGMVKVRV